MLVRFCRVLVGGGVIALVVMLGSRAVGFGSGIVCLSGFFV